ncbi:hypothetical protein J2W55_004043 [Mucilaginibacter pocheonensis]|uniref:Uncharacterized protein n=1 Tax=Mucilaginibacter pocheonensis TaxID=398050 RepID=A0ABU1TFT8_9SPHI|nr:hypothetical protein [Mucilaginibacter pocheonensis]
MRLRIVQKAGKKRTKLITKPPEQAAFFIWPKGKFFRQIEEQTSAYTKGWEQVPARVACIMH